MFGIFVTEQQVMENYGIFKISQYFSFSLQQILEIRNRTIGHMWQLLIFNEIFQCFFFNNLCIDTGEKLKGGQFE